MIVNQRGGANNDYDFKTRYFEKETRSNKLASGDRDTSALKKATVLAQVFLWFPIIPRFISNLLKNNPDLINGLFYFIEKNSFGINVFQSSLQIDDVMTSVYTLLFIFVNIHLFYAIILTTPKVSKKYISQSIIDKLILDALNFETKKGINSFLIMNLLLISKGYVLILISDFATFILYNSRFCIIHAIFCIFIKIKADTLICYLYEASNTKKKTKINTLYP